jgi:hypothetical protein
VTTINAVLRAIFKTIAFVVRTIQRWRSRHSHPHLVAEVAKTPYWGGVELPVDVRNVGQAAARDCRYCRRQRFTMDRGPDEPAGSAVAWYCTDSFDLPAGGSSVRHAAYATTDDCARIVLSDVPVPAEQYGRVVAALVCRDRFGVHYRVTAVDGRELTTDRWEEPLLNGLLPRPVRREPPEWTAWVKLPARIENRSWTAGFS